MPKKIEKKIKHNPVAKYARKFNKHQVHADKTKYNRKNKMKTQHSHKNSEENS